ncbi:MAG: PxxKW family cysteine-rich protein [Syntrophobacterales bacterium]|nr:PxxKW family cysteine-rich protein [Syntrophobacterales bacterium]
MVCQTIKAGIECAFMTKKGCGFNGGSCHQIIDKCEGCNKIIEYATGKYCMIYPNPAGKWAIGGCPSASHIKNDAGARDQKINPLKASKRAARK